MTQALLQLASTPQGDWSTSIRQVLQFDAEMLHVERVSFWSLGDDKSSLHCDAGYIASTRSFERGATLLESDQHAYFEAIGRSRILSIADVGGDPRTTDLREYSAARRIASVLDVPIWVDGRLSGLLCHEHVGRQRHWRPIEEDFAMGAGHVVASTLVARAQTLAETAAQRSAFLDTISRLILPSLNMDEIASRVVDQVIPRFADFAMIWSIDADGVLAPVAVAHADVRLREVVAEGARAAVKGGISPGLNYVVAQGQSLLYPDVAAAMLERLPQAQRDRATKLGLRSIINVPLAVGGTTLGAMAWFSSTRHYRNEDLALAEAVAERLAAALENARLYAMAHEAIRARDEFLVLAAHELRTPLTALQLLAHDMHPGRSSGAPADPARTAALDRQVHRLAALIERMCDAVRVRAEGIVLTRDPCDLASIIAARARALVERGRRGGSAIAVRTDATLSGQWDRARMGQLVDELLDNAVKFGEGKPIEVTLGQDGGDATLTVRDHGAGIPADRLSVVFSPFERAVPKEHFGGLGLGLHIAKSIVEAHGGSIAATSHPGQGTTMTVRLPLEPLGATVREVRNGGNAH
ncbi:MAG TPA: GAF domain-containing sensor histidine kinase [Polyangiaceae bacterium]|nr:GAF domain-containing sensor histidine kinase [Polyangiaceae bacterium]